MSHHDYHLMMFILYVLGAGLSVAGMLLFIGSQWRPMLTAAAMVLLGFVLVVILRTIDFVSNF